MRFLLFISTLFLLQNICGQDLKYLVHLRDKKDIGYRLSEPSAFLSERAIQRRQRHHIPIDSADLPVNASYLDSLSSLPSVKILNISRWFNQVLIAVPDSSFLKPVQSFPFVLSTEPVNNRSKIKIPAKTIINGQTGASARSGSPAVLTFDYGASANQIQIHHGDFLHNMGMHGQGMIIAILDDGFNNYISNPAFDSLRIHQRILGTFDFVNQKISVNEEASHGAECFSILASNMPGTLIGSAPEAGYWLFKTEDDATESPVEEQNWVAAAEFADSAGADLISTSLGYSYFDDSTYDLSYADRNGHRSLISRAANLAVAKGILVSAAAGNSGADTGERKYVSCPADGDSVYAVGAIDSKGVIGSFSSWGPNGSGQIKPDGVSVGVQAFLVAPDGSLASGNGTSFANPNLAGLIACLWEAFPASGVHDVLAAVRESSDRYSVTDNRYGYGIPDFEKAYQTLLIKSLPPINATSGQLAIRVFPVPFGNTLYIFFQPAVSGTCTIQLLDLTGKTMEIISLPIQANQPRLYAFKPARALSTGTYFIRYKDNQNSKTLKVLKD